MMQKTEFDEICRTTERFVSALKWAAIGIFAVVGLIAWNAYAKTMYHAQGKSWLRLFDVPCEAEKVLKHVPKEYHAAMKKAEGQFEGERFLVCWAFGNNMVVVVWEDGGTGMIPPGAFALENGG